VDAPEEAVLVRLIDVADLARKYGCDPNFEREKAHFVPHSCVPPHEAETKQPSASAGKAA
jgi:hypothetical protein